MDVRLVWPTIDREPEGDLHWSLSHLSLQPIKNSQRPECRLDRFVSAGLAPDCPRDTGIASLTCRRVVPAFAICVTNGMNRWKINHVETHFPCILHPG